MPETVRFAPSPTGRLHIGNARTALLNWLHAAAAGGRFILRFDDTDRERSTRAFADGIARDLLWLGITPHLAVRQSDRTALYDAAAERLRAMGRLYPCYETEEELDYRRKRQMALHRPPIYDRAALKLTPDDRARLEAEGRRPHWRFLLMHRTVTWNDGVRGPQHVETASLSDPVLIRADGSYLYTLPSVVDDIDLGVTRIIRGEDHVTNTGVQIELFEALGAAPPAFAHHNLLTLPSGEGLSKRLGHLSLEGLREAGFEPEAVAALAVLVGTSHPVAPIDRLQALVGRVKLADVSTSPAKFDPDEVAVLNARTLHARAYADVAARLVEASITGGEAFWLAVRGNLSRFREAAGWWQVVTGPITPLIAEADREFLTVAAAEAPPAPWDTGTWAGWTAVLKAKTGRKGRDLFMPLRRALTGHEHGPELAQLLPLIGREKALTRLTGEGA